MTTKKINIMLLSIIVILSGQLQARTCNPNITLVSPTDRFTINGDGTATDDQTGLMWMRCSLGLVWDSENATCTGTATTHDWKAALSAAESYTFASNSDWRLPNVRELTSITDIACYNPAINEEIFPETGSSDYNNYWSSSPDATAAFVAWAVDFASGDGKTAVKNNESRVRLVRTGQ